MSRFTDLFQEQEPVSTPEPVSAPEPVSVPQEKKSIKAPTPKKVEAKEAPGGAYRPTNNHK